MQGPSVSLRAVAFAVGVAALAVACSKVPITGRTQYNLVPDSIMRGLGKSSYQGILNDSKVIKKGADDDTLRRVGDRIAKVANEPKYDWTYSLIDSEEINAWCLSGGYIGVYSGILPVFQNESGMAFVVGHEVGHAVAHHGAERLSQSLTLLGGIAGLELYLANETKLTVEQQALVLGALGVGATVGVILPFSRMQESEADVIGEMYMASAGYPPGESITLWDRMDIATGGSSIPAFLSTHPADAKRQDHLREWLPQAKKRFERNKHPSEDPTKVIWPGLSAPGKKKDK